MASAGRILIMPKGDYDASVTYEMLDLVSYNGKSWLAKKTTVGIEPSEANNEHWQDMFNITTESIGALSAKKGGTINGNVSIQTQWATLALKDESERMVIIEKNPITGVLSIMNYSNVDNQNNLILTPETSEISESLYLRNVVNGTGNVYQIFGQHNIELLNQYIDARIAEYHNNNN